MRFWLVAITALLLVGCSSSRADLPNHAATAPFGHTTSSQPIAIEGREERQPPAARTAPVPTPELRRLIEGLKDAKDRTGVRRVGYDSAGRITFVWLTSDTANDESVRLVSNLQDLEHVTISCSWSRVTPEALATLRVLPHLRRLDLSFASDDVTFPFGVAVSQMQNLRELTIKYSRVEPESLIPLAALRQLRILRISDTQSLTDSSVAPLTALRGIEELDLSRTGITDACLDVVAGLPKLRQLTCAQTRITEAGVRQSKLAGRVAVRGAS